MSIVSSKVGLNGIRDLAVITYYARLLIASYITDHSTITSKISLEPFDCC